MGIDDKADNKKEDLGGKVKETVGKATGDDNLERQGANDQRKACIPPLWSRGSIWEMSSTQCVSRW